MTEIWKDIPGYGEHYQASSFGNIRSKDRFIMKQCPGIGVGMCKQFYAGRLLTHSRMGLHGYLGVHLGIDRKKYSVTVHKLILLAFVGDAPIGHECCHNNGISSDNRIENLRWDTHFQNNQDRKKHGKYAVGDKHPMAKLTSEIVLEIRGSGLNGPQVASKYCIGTSQAHRILTGRCWGHLSLSSGVNK